MSKIKNLLHILIRNRDAKNAGWLIGGQMLQMVISLFVGIFSARYLGPDNYGLINYASAFVSFFMAFCTLGIDSVIVKRFIDKPEEEGITLGSSILLRMMSSFLSACVIVLVVFFLDFGETETLIVVALYSISLIFHSLDTITYWFQAKELLKVKSVTSLIAYCVTASYKIVLLITGASVYWFAFAATLEYVALGLSLLVIYRKYKGPKLTFSLATGKSVLKESYHYILSGMMVAIYGQTDKLMLKQMLSETEVGYYSVATHICSLWTFVLSAVIMAMTPTILTLFEKDRDAFLKKNRQLYAIVFYVSVFVSIAFQVFGNLVVWILYGDAYMSAVTPLKIVTWYTAFSYLGVARNAWVVSLHCQKYLKYMYLGGTIANVCMNAVMIPLWGTTGAALASLITQIATSLLLPLAFREMRPNAKLMLDGILLKDVFPKKETQDENNE